MPPYARPLPQPELTNGTGSAKHGGPCTPAMAAGMTEHVWTLREMLQFRVPPWPQPGGMSKPRWWEAARAGGLGQATCVRTACFEDITRGERAAVVMS